MLAEVGKGGAAAGQGLSPLESHSPVVLCSVRDFSPSLCLPSTPVTIPGATTVPSAPAVPRSPFPCSSGQRLPPRTIAGCFGWVTERMEESGSGPLHLLLSPPELASPGALWRSPRMLGVCSPECFHSPQIPRQLFVLTPASLGLSLVVWGRAHRGGVRKAPKETG